MLELVSRPEALKNEVFASFIHSWQSRFDPRIDPYLREPGMYYEDPISDEPRYFSKEEIELLHNREIEWFESNKDLISPIALEKHGELIYNLDFFDIIVYSVELGNMMQKLSEHLNSKITFLLDYNVSWLHQKNDFKPVHDALTYLGQQGIDEHFAGGIKADGEVLAELFTRLFWIIRCNASLPYCWFTSDTDPFVGDVCKYGNFHFHCYSESIKVSIESFAGQNGMIKIDECFQNFYDPGDIEGRQIQFD